MTSKQASPIRLACIGDKAFGKRIEQRLSDSGSLPISLHFATTQTAGLKLLQSSVDAALIQQALSPKTTGLAFVLKARQSGVTLPLILVTAPEDDFSPRAAMSAGATDCLAETHLNPRVLLVGLLTETERRIDWLNAVFRFSPVAINIVDLAGRFKEVNDSYCKLVGYSAKQLLRMTIQDVTHPDDIEVNLSNLKKMATGEMFSFQREKRYIRSDGHILWGNLTTAVIPDERGQPYLSLGIIEDITERKRHEQTVSRQHEYLQALHNVTLGLLNNLDSDNIFEEIVTRAAHLMGTSDAYLYVFEPDSDQMSLRFGLGRYIGSARFTVKRGEGVTGVIWETKKPLLIADYSTWPGRLPEFKWVRSVMAAPLMDGDEVVGVLGMALQDPSRPATEDDVRTLEQFTELASLVARSARQYAASTRRSQELTLLDQARDAIAREVDLKSVLKRVVEGIGETFGYTLVSFYLRAADELVLQHQIGYTDVIERIPVTSGVIGPVVLSGKAILVDDVRSDPAFLHPDGVNVRSEVAVPVVADGRVAGVLNVESTQGVRLNQDDLRLMTALAEHIGLAISRATLIEKLSNQNAYLTALHEITLGLIQQADFGTLLETIVERAAELVGAPHVGLYLVDEEADEMYIKAGVGDDKKFLGFRQPRGVGVTGGAWDQNTHLVIEDYANWEGRMKGFEYVKAVAAIPMRIGHKVIGVLSVSFDEPRAIPDAEVDLLDRFAQLASIVVQNARIYAAEREQRALADTLRDASSSLNTTLDLDEVLVRILTNVERVVPHDAANIMLIEGDKARVTRWRGYERFRAEATIEGLALPISSSKTFQQLIAERKPQIVVDTVIDPKWTRGGPHDWLRSYLGAPIIIDDAVVGFLQLDSSKPDYFTQQHAERLVVFASHAAAAIQNANRFKQAETIAAFEERQRLAHDLHDSVSQTLFSASIISESLYRLIDQDPATVKDGLKEVHRLTRGAQAEMRTLLMELRPNVLLDATLDDLLHHLRDVTVGQLARPVDLHIDEQQRLPSDVHLVVYRVAQEALNNVIKYSKADHVEVKLTSRADSVSLQVKDDGVGFDPTDVPPNHFGLGIMRERADGIGAGVTIESARGKGTEVCLEWKRNSD